MTGTLITAIATVFAGAITVLVTYFVKRTDRVAKATRSHMQDQQYTMQLVGIIRDDYWGLSGWAYPARERFNTLRDRWNMLHPADLEPPLRRIPKPRHEQLEKRHSDGEDTSDDEE